MGTMASQITSLTIVYSTVYSGGYQRKHQSSASLAFVRGIHRSPVNSPHKGPVTRKMFPFNDVIMRNFTVSQWEFLWCQNTSELRSINIWQVSVQSSCNDDIADNNNGDSNDDQADTNGDFKLIRCAKKCPKNMSLLLFQKVWLSIYTTEMSSFGRKYTRFCCVLLWLCCKFSEDSHFIFTHIFQDCCTKRQQNITKR